MVISLIPFKAIGNILLGRMLISAHLRSIEGFTFDLRRDASDVEQLELERNGVMSLVFDFDMQ